MDDEEIPFVTEKDLSKPGTSNSSTSKPLFKLKLKDVLDMVYDAEKDGYMFRNRVVNLVMCGGRIKNIFEDDKIFSFEVDDGAGNVVHCFHKYKNEDAIDADKFERMLNEVTVHFPESTPPDQEATMFENTAINNTLNNTVVRSYNYEAEKMVQELGRWFRDEVLAKKKDKEVGNLIHFRGYVTDSESIRKVNVVDFRIVENELEYEDFLLELEFLYKKMY